VQTPKKILPTILLTNNSSLTLLEPIAEKNVGVQLFYQNESRHLMKVNSTYIEAINEFG